MEFVVNGKNIEIKFNYGAFFRVNSEFSTHDKDGDSMQDGATNLFLRIMTGDLVVLSDALPVITGKKISDDQLDKIIDEMTDSGNKIDEVLNELKEELLNSGFFNKSIQKQKETIKEAIPEIQKMIKTEKNEDKKLELENREKSMQKVLKLLNENV